ncbi:aromatic ring-hydroxylating oxygenase subunit alpha [Pseudonocardia endophytica]|uniref:Phenylpropionate dioxygenase-like ring-hydroxylating dioxygenase large terminal subunit n=1 Tax=Pseudonocardia endophytica TaxID=401976 RepID=A0A4R1I216_PSEEN|nr:aromatic ring-hydroxylating dioxygenase subunit alpha [Pseudonocardia endophytica]TCK27635.1 phenylpropionate dioxygenase-like ring-hydroxylating dioxygenase large terminal subunit [Pseudonocardia endophytica]
MESTTERRIIADIRQLIEGRTTAMADEVRRQPTSVYVDPERHVAERQVLFRRYPSAVALTAQVANPNDFVTTTVAGIPVIVVRGDDGVVRCLVNICRHRANRVCDEKSGNRRMFACQFHAWTYTTKGHCRSFVDREGFADIGREDFGLRELPCEERHGLVWCLPDADVPLDMAGYLGPVLDAELSDYDVGSQTLYASTRLEKPFNWKLGVDTFHEVFHLAFLHKKTVGPLFLGNLAAYEKIGLHHRFVPVRSTFPDVLARPEAEQELLPHAGVVYYVFPATFINWQMDHMEIWTVAPDARRDDACVITASMLVADPPSTERETRHWDRNWTMLRDSVMTEDFDTMEIIQSNIESGAVDELAFGRNEIGLQNFHRDLEAELARHAAGQS